MTRALITPVRPSSPAVELVSGCHFKLKHEQLFEPLVGDAPPRVQDLLAIAAAIYSGDRLIRRNAQSVIRGQARVVDAEIEVDDPAFWNSDGIAELLHEILFVLSGDEWRLRFVDGRARHWQTPLIERSGTVCLYSGGLDSLAGLSARLHEGLTDVVAVTMLHVGRQRSRVEQQVRALTSHFGKRIFPVFVPMALVSPPRLSDQEVSQRCRSFIFTALGVGAAAAINTGTIELYESGVGAVNVPLMSGMSVGGRTTKGCHPRFLALMTRLSSEVLGRPIRFVLPFASKTKAEVVQIMRQAGISDLARTSFSCIHTSPRVKGEPHHCGVCPACIGRRQALLTAGVPDESHVVDLFDPMQAAAATSDQLLALKAILMQVASLSRHAENGLPPIVQGYLESSGIVPRGRTDAELVALLRRYADEWQALVKTARTQGVCWTKWLAN